MSLNPVNDLAPKAAKNLNPDDWGWMGFTI